jgi:predicted RNase H-like nuclease (RuvC/YqgF family)
MLQSYMVVPNNLDDSRIASEKKDKHNEKKTIEELENENAQLKHTIELLSKRVADLERTQQENNMLRSSIIQFRQDIQRQVL